jgi:CRISPR-associated protein Cmr3
MAYYQIKLTPVDTFFFGGEKHDNEEVVNYFVESNCYPQQTTLLGFLRYLLLVRNNLIGSDMLKTKAEPIIGEKSFNYQIPQQSFGEIKSISLLYFLKGEQVFVPAPFDVNGQIELENDNYILKIMGKPYKAKDGLPNLHLISIKGDSTIRLYDEGPLNSVVFKVLRTGNEKSDKGESNEDSFYRQSFMRMNTDWSFAFQAEIEEDLATDTLFLPFGGEQSMFKVDIVSQEKKIELSPELKNYSRKLPLIYLLSDCFVEDNIMQLTCFAVNRISSFRNFQSSVNTMNYSAFGKNSNGLKRSNRYNLITRGSVLYFSNNNEREQALKLLEKNHCKKIGFNHYKLIN